MKSETNKRTAAPGPACWQREAPCACLRIEVSASETHLFQYAHLVSASLICVENSETLRLGFSAHDVEIIGRNLRGLLFAIQDFAVKWIRAIPERYQLLEASESGVVSSIRIQQVQEN